MLFADPAKVRGAPLGWAFPLAFLVHGLMPVGGAVGSSFAVGALGAKIAIIAGGAALSALVVGMLLRFALRARRRVERFREAMSAPRYDARVLEVVDLGSAGRVGSTHGRTYYQKAWTRVMISPPSAAPFERAGEACYERSELARLTPGAHVSVSCHPSDAAVLFIDPRSIAAIAVAPGAAYPNAPSGMSFS